MTMTEKPQLTFEQFLEQDLIESRTFPELTVTVAEILEA